ncbi:sugar-binding transcriptional regulator [Pseudonocardia sp. HH130630-07]|uniref:sugar-binding transcriptional regulator n=1 Tax=Pseudonocardia sp. HH130630-07 TaxID=1690815 RepID=UPI0018D4166E|nr:sugar-binding domain-containing protein [Pseudonocardia sp. HH130630-07]
MGSGGVVDGRSEVIGREVVLEVARAYYLQDRSKTEIARSTGLSRWQVARLLAEARADGTVQIRVGDPAGERTALAGDLTAALGRYGVRDTLVVAATESADEEPAVDAVTGALATLLTSLVDEGAAVGLAWSRVIERLPRRLERLAPCQVVQLAGALSFPGDRLGSVEVTREVARRAGGTAFPFYAPLFVDAPAAAAALREQPEVARCLERVEHLDVAVVSVGHWSEHGSAVHPLVPAGLSRRTADAGAVGEISGRLLDAGGGAVRPGLDQHVVGITLDGLRRVPVRIATSHGRYRARATLAAVRAGLVSHLVVDQSQAEALLATLAAPV